RPTPPPTAAMPPRTRTTTPQTGNPPSLEFASCAPGSELVTPPGRVTGEPAPGEPAGMVSTAPGVPLAGVFEVGVSPFAPGVGELAGAGVRVGAGVNVGI